jgi:hypothetical protein
LKEGEGVGSADPTDPTLVRKPRTCFPPDFPDGCLTGSHGLIIDQYGAGAAQPLAAAVFGAGQNKIYTESRQLGKHLNNEHS